jgi:hypothetical protein
MERLFVVFELSLDVFFLLPYASCLERMGGLIYVRLSLGFALRMPWSRPQEYLYYVCFVLLLSGTATEWYCY